MQMNYVYLIHILFVAPLLIYSGYIGNHLSEQCNNKEYVMIFKMLGMIGLVVLLYHGHGYLKINNYL
jgi:hypothetical protein